MEYAMMVTMGAVNHNTVVITTVHDCQIVDIPDELIDDHDLTVKLSKFIIQCPLDHKRRENSLTSLHK